MLSVISRVYRHTYAFVKDSDYDENAFVNDSDYDENAFIDDIALTERPIGTFAVATSTTHNSN